MTFIAPVILIFVILTVGIKYLWSFMVVRLFPGAVKENLIVEEISWGIASIFALVFVLLSH